MMSTDFKRRRKVITLDTKLKILNLLSNGRKVVDVAKLFLLNEATVRTIRANENSIRNTIAIGTDESLCQISHVRDAALERMESALVNWLNEQNKKLIKLDSNVIKNKALEIYTQLTDPIPTTSEAGKKQSFTASKSWYEKFKQRNSQLFSKIKRISKTEEIVKDVAQEVVHNGYWTATWSEAFDNENSHESQKSIGHSISPLEESFTDIHDVTIKTEELDGDNIFNDNVCNNVLENGNDSNVSFKPNIIRDGLDLGRILGNYFLNNDPNNERSLKFQHELNKCLKVYEDLYKDICKN